MWNRLKQREYEPPSREELRWDAGKYSKDSLKHWLDIDDTGYSLALKMFKLCGAGFATEGSPD